MRKRWAEHNTITGITDEMKKDLPKGLKAVGNNVKVPEDGVLREAYYGWCVRHGIGNGFCL